MRSLMLAFATVLVAAQPALAASKAVLTAYDELVRPAESVKLRFKVERDNLVRYDLKGVKVDYWLWQTAQSTWSYLGRATSGDDGYADLNATSPASRGAHLVAGKVAPGQRYESGWRYLYLGVRDATERIVVTDIDQTIAAAEWYEFLWKNSPRVEPVRGAVQALTDVSKDATVVYLTARDDYFGTKTRGWIAHWAFPKGPVICSDGLTMVGDPTDFKAAAIAALKAKFPNIVAGFGNKPTDHEAYTRNGLWSYQWDTQTKSFPAGTLVYHDFEDLRAAIRRGERPELAWARFYR
jgi:hypothetical protein